MPRLVGSVKIEASAESIWELLSDPHRFPEFVDGIERMTDIPDERIGVGYTYKDVEGIPPFRGEVVWRFTEFEPSRRQVQVGSDGFMRYDMKIDLEPIGDRTRLTIAFDLQPRWYFAPVTAILWPLVMRRRSQASIERTVVNVKRIVESASVGGAPSTDGKPTEKRVTVSKKQRVSV